MLYSRPQLRLLLVLAALFLAGLGVREWRAGFPDMAARLERFDHEEPVTPTRSDDRPPTSRVTSKLSVAPRTRAVAATMDRPEIPAPTPASPTPDRQPVDVNRASVAELSRLPGIGAVLAQRIVDERERRGRFESVDALRQVGGVGPKKLAAFRELVTVGE